jgi:hypothetical protein
VWILLYLVWWGCDYSDTEPPIIYSNGQPLSGRLCR